MGRCCWVFLAVFLMVGVASAHKLVTGQSMKLVPGDKVLFFQDFGKCPIGELPLGFDKTMGAGECVRYGNQIWFTSIMGEAGLMKK